MLELKACDEITIGHEAQLLHYLKATSVEIGFVLAFGQCPKFKRRALTHLEKHVPCSLDPH